MSETHIDPKTLKNLATGSLDQEQASTVTQHLAECEICRKLHSEMQQLPEQPFPGYHVEAELGRGGMGVVYAAQDIQLDRPVAIKVLNSTNLTSELLQRRFREEALITSQLQHPGIPPIHELGNTSDGRP